MDIVGLTNLLSDIGALGVSVLVIWGLLTDRLITQSRLNEMRADRDRAIAELELERARHGYERQ